MACTESQKPAVMENVPGKGAHRTEDFTSQDKILKVDFMMEAMESVVGSRPSKSPGQVGILRSHKTNKWGGKQGSFLSFPKQSVFMRPSHFTFS